MYALIVSVEVIPDFIPAFIEITRYNAQQAIKEPACLRFDFYQQLDKPECFHLLEVYDNPDGQKSHKETEHYQLWKKTVAPMMAKDRTFVALKNIEPEDDAWIKP